MPRGKANQGMYVRCFMYMVRSERGMKEIGTGGADKHTVAVHMRMCVVNAGQYWLARPNK